MSKPNKLSQVVAKIYSLPTFLQVPALSKAFGSIIKYAGHSGVKVEKMSHNECIVSLKNKKKVQNHIGGIHAAAMALLAESATGFVCGMNAPDDKILVIKKMNIDYVKRSTGAMRAVATLSDEQIHKIKTEEKGDVIVAVTITDEVNVEPIKAEMTWAWVSKKR